MNYGDFPLEETIHMLFTTRAFATGIPGTLSAATVAVYEDITATPIETSIAVTESLNSIAGLNAVPIAALAASGYELGKNYHVVIEAGTVGGVSIVGEVIGYFSIGRSAAAVDLANGTDGLGAIKAETALIVADTGELQADDTPTAIAAVQTVVDAIPAVSVSGTADSGTAGTMVDAARTEGDTDYWRGQFIRFTTGNLAGQTSRITGFTPASDTITFSPSVTQAVAAGIGYEILPNGVALGATSDLPRVDVQAIFDDVTAALNFEADYNGTGYAKANSTIGTTTTLTGHTVQTGDTFALANGAAGFVAIDTVVDTILVDTAAMQPLVAKIPLSDGSITWNATALGSINTQVDTALTDIHLDHLMAVAAADVIVDGSVIAHMVSTTEDWSTFIPSSDSLQSIRGKQTDIEADTNELQGDWVNTGRLDTILDLILADTGELQTDWVDGGRLDALLDLVATTADLLDKVGAVSEAAAAGDPSAVESVMQYVKQIVNLLAGSDGIATMPSGLDPANGVNLFEMLRASMGATFATTTDDLESLSNRLPAALSGGRMSSDMTAISESGTAADNLEVSTLGIVVGTATGTPTTTVIDTGLTEATTDHYKGRILTFVTGAVAGQSTDITGYNGTTKELTVTALTNAPASTDAFVIT